MDELKKRCDKIWSMIIRSTGRCASCHHQPPDVRLEAAHILPRRYTATRWDTRNGICLCSFCHRWYTGRPDRFTSFVSSVVGGPEVLRRLVRDAQTVNHPDVATIYEGLLTEAMFAGVAVDERVRW